MEVIVLNTNNGSVATPDQQTSEKVLPDTDYLYVIAITACIEFDVSEKKLFSREQTAEIAIVRHAIAYAGRELVPGKISYPKLGKFMMRYHTSALNSYRRAQALLDRRKDFQDCIKSIEAAIVHHLD